MAIPPVYARWVTDGILFMQVVYQQVSLAVGGARVKAAVRRETRRKGHWQVHNTAVNLASRVCWNERRTKLLAPARAHPERVGAAQELFAQCVIWPTAMRRVGQAGQPADLSRANVAIFGATSSLAPTLYVVARFSTLCVLRSAQLLFPKGGQPTELPRTNVAIFGATAARSDFALPATTELASVGQ
jgi:hypothetical protein